MKRLAVAAVAALTLVTGCAAGHGQPPKIENGKLSHAYVESWLSGNAARVTCNDGHDMPLRQGAKYWCHFEGKLTRPKGNYRYLEIVITDPRAGKFKAYEAARSPRGAY